MTVVQTKVHCAQISFYCLIIFCDSYAYLALQEFGTVAGIRIEIFVETQELFLSVGGCRSQGKVC